MKKLIVLLVLLVGLIGCVDEMDGNVYFYVDDNSEQRLVNIVIDKAHLEIANGEEVVISNENDYCVYSGFVRNDNGMFRYTFVIDFKDDYSGISVDSENESNKSKLGITFLNTAVRQYTLSGVVW